MEEQGRAGAMGEAGAASDDGRGGPLAMEVAGGEGKNLMMVDASGLQPLDSQSLLQLTSAQLTSMANSMVGLPIPHALPLSLVQPGMPVDSRGNEAGAWLSSLLTPPPGTDTPTSGGGGSGGAGPKQKRSRSANWTVEEEITLVGLYQEMEAKHETRKALWETLSASLLEKGFDRKPLSLEQKWCNLLQTFRNIKEYNRTQASQGCSTSFYMLTASERKQLYSAWKVNSLDQRICEVLDEFLGDRGRPDHSAPRITMQATPGRHWLCVHPHRSHPIQAARVYVSAYDSLLSAVPFTRICVRCGCTGSNWLTTLTSLFYYYNDNDGWPILYKFADQFSVGGMFCKPCILIFSITGLLFFLF